MSVQEIEAGAVPTDSYLLDVREPEEWVAGHAPDAVHIPMSQIQERVGEVPGDRTIYVVCRVGGRSLQVAAWLNRLGHEAVNVGGGMKSWEASGRTMVSETGQEPFVA
jgi:rhodanese-related sulfurtransferase